MAGQDLTCWGLPSLRRAVADQWNTMIPPTLEENPQRPSLRQSRRDLTSPGRVIWRTSAAQTTGNPLGRTDEVRTHGVTLGAGMAAGASGRKSRVTANRLRGSTPDFMSDDPLAFPFPKVVFKAAELLSNGRGTDAGCSGRPWNKGLRGLQGCTALLGTLRVLHQTFLVLDEWQARVHDLHLPWVDAVGEDLKAGQNHAIEVFAHTSQQRYSPAVVTVAAVTLVFVQCDEFGITNILGVFAFSPACA